MEQSNKQPSIFKNKAFIFSLIFSFLLLVISLIVNHFAGIYVNERVSNSVTDIFLSNIRVYDVDMVFLYGPILFWFFIFIISLKHYKRIPFLLYNIGLFIIIRSIFVSLTHLGPFPTQATVISDNIISRLSSGNDLFFSAHTGLPYLMALIFWDIKPIRIVCILTAIFFGIVVLLGHYHYSIDVLSAFFITYGIFKIAKTFFKKERSFFSNK